MPPIFEWYHAAMIESEQHVANVNDQQAPTIHLLAFDAAIFHVIV